MIESISRMMGSLALIIAQNNYQHSSLIKDSIEKRKEELENQQNKSANTTGEKATIFKYVAAATLCSSITSIFISDQGISNIIQSISQNVIPQISRVFESTADKEISISSGKAQTTQREIDYDFNKLQQTKDITNKIQQLLESVLRDTQNATR
jgi:hypothetical protein